MKKIFFKVKSIPFKIKINEKNYYGTLIEETTLVCGFKDHSYRIEWNDSGSPEGVDEKKIINMIINK